MIQLRVARQTCQNLHGAESAGFVQKLFRVSGRGVADGVPDVRFGYEHPAGSLERLQARPGPAACGHCLGEQVEILRVGE